MESFSYLQMRKQKIWDLSKKIVWKKHKLTLQYEKVIINHLRRIAKYGDYDCSTINVRQSNDEHRKTGWKKSECRMRGRKSRKKKNEKTEERQKRNETEIICSGIEIDINIDSCQLHRDRNLILNKLIQYIGWLLSPC